MILLDGMLSVVVCMYVCVAVDALLFTEMENAALNSRSQFCCLCWCWCCCCYCSFDVDVVVSIATAIAISDAR